MMQKKQKISRLGKAIFPAVLGILIVLIIVSGVMAFQALSIKKKLNAIQKEAVETAKEEIQIYLPEIYYAAAGSTVEIYNSQVTSQCGNITKYNVLWNCDIGENLERKYSLTAGEEMIGEHELTLSVYDNSLKLLAEKKCMLKVVDGSLEKEMKTLEINGEKSFPGEETQADLIRIFMEADNTQDGEKNAQTIIKIIDEMRSSGVTKPICVMNAVYQQVPNQEAFYLMTDLSERLEKYENVYYVPVGISVDSEYNYEEGSLNRAGYAQMEDMFFAVYCAAVNEIQ